MGRAESGRAALDHCDSLGAFKAQHVESRMVGMTGVDEVEVAGAQVTGLGLARSGVAACRLLQEAGAHVTVADRKHESELTGVLGNIDRDHVHVAVGAQYERSLDYCDLVVISPGVPYCMDAL